MVVILFAVGMQQPSHDLSGNWLVYDVQGTYSATEQRIYKIFSLLHNALNISDLTVAPEWNYVYMARIALADATH